MQINVQMNKFHILVIILFGFLLMPSGVFACENNSAKKEASSKTCNDGCCKKDEHSKNKSHHACNGKCGHSNCVTTSSQNSAVFFEIKFNRNEFSFSEKKQNFYNYETPISSGFNSVWLIPKIG
jgi:hypothetical protein